MAWMSWPSCERLKCWPFSDRIRLASSSLGTTRSPGKRQPHRSERPGPTLPDLEGRAGGFQTDLARAQVRVGRFAVGDDAALDAGKDLEDSGVVQARHDRPVERNAVGKGREGFEDVREI